jgi:hypothetical protein
MTRTEKRKSDICLLKKAYGNMGFFAYEKTNIKEEDMTMMQNIFIGVFAVIAFGAGIWGWRLANEDTTENIPENEMVQEKGTDKEK